MPLRTRRIATQKQNQYRITEDEKVDLPQSKRVYGGVLTAAGANVPKLKKKPKEIRSPPRVELTPKRTTTLKDQTRTPPLPSSVVIGDTLPFVSPPTHAKFSETSKSAGRTVDNHALDDGISAMSYDTFSPPSKSRLRSIPVKDDDVDRIFEDGSSDDDQTIDLDGSETLNTDNKDDDVDASATYGDHDPDETILEDETLKDEDEDSAADSESEGYDSESELEEDEEESLDEDDEYVPDEEGDSASEDDLSDYVEVEKRPRRGRGLQEKKTNKNASSLESVELTVSPEDNGTDNQTVDEGIHIESPHSIKSTASRPEEADPLMDDDATEAEATPAKPSHSSGFPAGMMSPEPEVAVVVEETDFEEDEVLVATIIDDEPLNGRPDMEKKRDVKKGGKEGVTEDTARQSVAGDEDEGVCEEATKGVTSSSSPAPSTPPSKTRKSRKKSFYRQEGIVKKGKWTLGSKIGVGSFGVVHVGMNNETGMLMAVKKFKVDGAVMKDLRREVELMRSLKHKNIVRYLGAQMDKTHLHIFQEWVPGGSVAALLGKFGPFTMQVIRSYLSQTLSGLVYLHDNDIMHRDIKGSNILVNDEGIVKLADFGASKKLANLKDNLMMSLTVRGTPYFMAPEVFEEKYSAKADIWGIGCVAHQMSTGSPPWKDQGFTNPISLFNHIKNHDGPPNVDNENRDRLSGENSLGYQLLQSMLEKCFLKDPSLRPTASQLLEDRFFIEVHEHDDDETSYSRYGLFSPTNETTAGWEQLGSPATASKMDYSPSPRKLPAPSPSSHSRSKSVVQWKTSFLSPPRPKRNPDHASPSPHRTVDRASPRSLQSSSRCSPKPDSSDWPEWARAELQRQRLFEGSPNKSPGMDRRGDRDISDMMGSLALSADSNATKHMTVSRASPGRPSTGSTMRSQLVGLDFLDASASTFEI